MLSEVQVVRHSVCLELGATQVEGGQQLALYSWAAMDSQPMADAVPSKSLACVAVRKRRGSPLESSAVCRIGCLLGADHGPGRLGQEFRVASGGSRAPNDWVEA